MKPNLNKIIQEGLNKTKHAKSIAPRRLPLGLSQFNNGGDISIPQLPQHQGPLLQYYYAKTGLEVTTETTQHPYSPSQTTNNAKAILAGVDAATGFSGNPYVQAGNFLTRLANSTGDAYTAARYAMDGQWDNAAVDAGEALLDLIPFRKGSKVGINLSKTNPNANLKLSKLDRSLNNVLKVGKAGASADDFMHSSIGKFLFGNPNSQVQYKTGGDSSWMLTNPKPHPVIFPRMAEGGEESSDSSSNGPGDDELAFQQFFKTLPLNLRKDSPDYNIRGYWDSLGRPKAFDYTQPKEDDGYYHAFSRNPQTGEILKRPQHPTFKRAIEEDRKAGYFPIVTPDGKVKTVSGYDLKPGQSIYANGGELLNRFEPGGVTGCPSGFTKNAFGQCVNTSGQTPEQAGASASIIQQAVNPNLSNNPLATPFKTRGQQIKESTDRANRENYHIGEFSNQASVRQGQASTPESEAQRLRLNQQYAAQQPNAQIDTQGNVSRVNPNRSVTGAAENFMSRREDKAGEHIMGALDAAGYVTGAGELANLGWGALKKGIGKSMESGLLSNTYKLNPWKFKPSRSAFYNTEHAAAENISNQYGKLLGTSEGKELSFYKGAPKDQGGRYMVEHFPVENEMQQIPFKSKMQGYWDDLKTQPLTIEEKSPKFNVLANVGNDNTTVYKKDWLQGWKNTNPNKYTGFKKIEQSILPDFSGIKNYAKELYLTSKDAGKFKLPTYKDIYRMEPTSFAKDADQLSGRWFTDKPGDLKFYIGNKDTTEGVGSRLLKERVSDRVYNQNFGENMPTIAKQKSVGFGKFGTLENVINSNTVSPKAAKSLLNGFDDADTFNEVIKNPLLFNETEGIMPDLNAYRLRGLKSNRPFSPYTRLEGTNQMMPGIVDDIINEHWKSKKFGIPKKYLPFKEGGWLDTYDDGGILGNDCPEGYYKHSTLGCIPIPNFTANEKEKSQIKVSNKPITKDANYGQKVDPYENIIAKDTKAKQTERYKDLANRAAISAGIAGAVVTGGAAAPYILPALEAPIAGVAGLTGNNILAGVGGYNLANNLTNGTIANRFKNAKDWKDYAAATGETAFDVAGALPMAGSVAKGMSNAIRDINFKKYLNPISEKVLNYSNTLKAGPFKEHLKGLAFGMSDIAEGRPFSQTFPITKAQKLKMINMQNEAANEGTDFVKNWFYGEGNTLRPEVEDRITNILPKLKRWQKNNLDYDAIGNPIANTENKLVSSRRSQLRNNSNLSDDSKDYITFNRGNIGGVNKKATDEAVTLRNSGFYYHTPEQIKNVAGHELTHSGQRLGYNTPSHGPNDPSNWSEVITSKTPDKLYYEANPNTELGKKFREVMTEAVPGKKTWAASPDELHSETMVGRKNYYDWLTGPDVKKTPEQAMKRLQNPTDDDLKFILHDVDLNRFFKPGTPNKTKFDIIRLLPAAIPAVAGAAALKQNKYGGGINRFDGGGPILPGTLSTAVKEYMNSNAPVPAPVQQVAQPSSPQYQGPSIVDFLATKGYPGNKEFRKDLASIAGVEDYNFSAQKNLELLAKLRENNSILGGIQPTQQPISVDHILQMEKESNTTSKLVYDKKTSQPSIQQVPVKPLVSKKDLNARINLSMMNFNPNVSANTRTFGLGSGSKPMGATGQFNPFTGFKGITGAVNIPQVNNESIGDSSKSAPQQPIVNNLQRSMKPTDQIVNNEAWNTIGQNVRNAFDQQRNNQSVNVPIPVPQNEDQIGDSNKFPPQIIYSPVSSPSDFKGRNKKGQALANWKTPKPVEVVQPIKEVVRNPLNLPIYTPPAGANSSRDFNKLQEQAKYLDVPQGQGKPFEFKPFGLKPVTSKTKPVSKKEKGLMDYISQGLGTAEDYIESGASSIKHGAQSVIEGVENTAGDIKDKSLEYLAGAQRLFEKTQDEDPNSIVKPKTNIIIPKTPIVVKKGEVKKLPDSEYGYKELYSVPDVKGSKGDSLVSFTNTFNNDEGAKYYVGNKIKEVTDAKAKGVYDNVQAVAHFLRDSDILPGQKVAPKEWTVHGGTKFHSTSPGKALSATGFNEPNRYRTLYRRDPNKPNDPNAYLVKYIKNKDITPNVETKLKSEGWGLDFTVSGQHKFSDVDWEGNGPSTGYLAKSKFLPLKGGGHTYIPYKDKNGFSRFSGGSITYLFKHPETGESIGVDLSGSVNTLKEAGKELINKYKLNPNNLEFIYHDMGSYSAKPKSKNGKLSYKQWQNYNVFNGGFSGAPLMIPKKKLGGNVGDEMDLTDEQIQELIKQGYKIQHL